MSSWANRGILRKRTGPPIPTIQPVQPRILQNEPIPVTTQQKLLLTQSQKPQQQLFRNVPSVKKIQTLPSPTAIELKHNKNTYVFVILRHLRNSSDNELWINSYNSIRKYYTNRIIIIDDNSLTKSTEDAYVSNTDIVYSEYKGAGEILPYYYFLKYKWADKMIFLHDSMFLHRPFKESEIDSPIKFHWYFPSNESYDYKSVLNYISLLNNSNELIDYINNIENRWKGCFGVASIIDYNIVNRLEEKYNIFTRLTSIVKKRKDRETCERIFSIICFYDGAVNSINCANFGNIMSYPSAFISTSSNNSHQLVTEKGYDTAIIKVWRGR